MKKFFSIPFCLALTASSIFCQGITTASDFFKSISERYSEVQDYEADVTITIGKTEMSGRVSYKQPEMLRIDFSDPAERSCFSMVPILQSISLDLPQSLSRMFQVMKQTPLLLKDFH